ncbi:MAG: PE-PPE domain-containing protein [Mycobacterium sp.]
MRGILAAAGAASITAACAITAPNVMLTANVLTVTGYTAGGTLHFDMSEMFQGAYCSESSGNTCTPVRYLSGLPVVGEADGLRALTSAIRTAQAPTTVVGFSQGALISSAWLEDNAGKAGAPATEDLSFVLVANPLRKYGGVRPVYDLGDPTPETDYSVLDIAIEYDGAADFPDDPFNLLALANAFAGFQYVHISRYDDVDLENAEKLVWQDGNTTYVLIRSQNIPLLEPLRILGLNELADRLNDPLKAIIDSAYDRDYPGLIDPESHDDVLQQFSVQDDAEDDTDTPIFTSLMAERGAQSDDATDDDVSTAGIDAPPADTAIDTSTDTDPDDRSIADLEDDPSADDDSNDDTADDVDEDDDVAEDTDEDADLAEEEDAAEDLHESEDTDDSRTDERSSNGDEPARSAADASDSDSGDPDSSDSDSESESESESSAD